MLIPLLLLAFAVPAQARADWIPVTFFGPDTNTLVEECRHYAAPPTTLRAQACVSFIAGVVDGAQAARMATVVCSLFASRLVLAGPNWRRS